MIRDKLSVSIVLPCLNEARSLSRVISEARHAASEFDECEILIVDNGSDDNSAEIAEQNSAQVIHCKMRGYGAAIRQGISKAQFPIVVIADADGTYDLRECPKLVRALVCGENDIVIGNRLSGKIEKDSMPFKYRFISAPFLSGLITLLHGHGVRVGDCNSGMRAFRRADFLRWKVSNDGMDFSTETIVRSLVSGARYCEVPITYRRADPERSSHLRTWRDGLRLLLVILRIPIPKSRY